jgi:hypothetical protein
MWRRGQEIILTFTVLLDNIEPRSNDDLLLLRWPFPPRNVLLIKKKGEALATESLVIFAK